MQTPVAITNTVEIYARELYPEQWEGRFSEGCDLLQVASRMTAIITDSHLIDWKRSRGPISTEEMASDKSRNRWLKFARAILELRQDRQTQAMRADQQNGINNAIAMQATFIKERIERIAGAGSDYVLMRNIAMSITSMSQVLETMCKEAAEGKTTW